MAPVAQMCHNRSPARRIPPEDDAQGALAVRLIHHQEGADQGGIGPGNVIPHKARKGKVLGQLNVLSIPGAECVEEISLRLDSEHGPSFNAFFRCPLARVPLPRQGAGCYKPLPFEMNLQDFDFELPKEQIAQAPLPERDASRLMTLGRSSGRVGHHRFRDLPELLRPGDLLVVNDARVIPARLLGQKTRTLGHVELLVLHPAAAQPTAQALDARADAWDWICLGQASKGLKVGTELTFEGGLTATVQETLGGGEYRIRFATSHGEPLAQALGKAGQLPLPPYISRPPTAEDENRYQTVYAQAPGSVAAPTAGLHFTDALFAKLADRGISRVSITLEVGPGTFLPVREDDVSKHKMHVERYTLPSTTAAAIRKTKATGGRVVAVGTTVVRTLESATDTQTGALREGPGETALFLKPGDPFHQVDALVTNFHLPRSTLLLLVSAFAGREPTLSAYREAVASGYRFFSYGDAMLIGD